MKQILFGSLKRTMLFAFGLLSLITVGVVAAVSIWYGIQTSRALVLEELTAEVELNEQAINNWLGERLYNLTMFTHSPIEGEVARQILRGKSVELAQFRQRLQLETTQMGRFAEIFLIGLDGRVVFSTQEANLGQNHRHQPHFQAAQQGAYISGTFFNVSASEHQIIVSVPITDTQGQVLGVLAGRLRVATLTQFVLTRNHTTQTSEVYLVSQDRQFITQLREPPQSGLARSEAIDQALSHEGHGQGIYENYNRVRVVGAYRWLPELRIVLLSERAEAEALAGVQRLTLTIGGVALGVLLLAITLALFLTSRLTRPIYSLITVAQAITAGKLESVAEIHTHNEIGLLGQAFNTMTNRLTELIDTLEEKVHVRTQALETNAEISYGLTSILNLTELTNYIVLRLKTEYNFYHTQILILDQERLHLIAATHEALLEENLSIPLTSSGLMAKAARTQKAVMVNEVLASPDWLPHPLLPETQAEIAIPIMFNHQVLGVLDVQQTEAHSFDEGQANLLQALANQIGVAMQNARLYSLAQQELAERKRAEAALQKANEELAKLNKDKDRFFSIVAHDLKGPFMPLLGTSELMAEMADMLKPSDIQEMSLNINRSAKNVFHLLENLLHWSRLQQGHMQYQPETIELGDLVENTVNLLFSNAQAKGIHLHSTVAANIHVYADRYMLDTVIRNLTSNALKFTPPQGEVVISAQLHAANPHTHTEEFVEVAIADTGIGMPEEVQQKLFRIDEHVTTLGTAKEQGTGLGLIICQEMVVKSGGRIWVESEVGKGTTVKFTVKLQSL